jgi:parallel beta-helix repeat protein
VLLLSMAAACGNDEGLVRVAAPTGDRTRDQASVRAALDAVGPGGTIRFAPGTYLIGADSLVVPTSDIRLVGDPDEPTILRGCTADEMAPMDVDAFFTGCGGLVLTGARQAVSGLTFEQFGVALWVAGPPDSTVATPQADVGTMVANTAGGHLIEDNTFRNVISMQVMVDADSAVVIRRNRFRNTYHAIAILGRNVHFVGNDVSAPEPERVPFGWPSLAIGLRPQPGVPCTGNRIEGNTVDGHTDGVVIGVLPPDGPGAVCEGNSVKDNTIRMRPVVHSKDAGPLAGTPAIGVPIRLLNMQAAMALGAMTIPMPAPPGGWPPAFAQAGVRDNVIEGNRIEGAKGVAIELLYASGNRVTGNTIGAVTPFTEAERTTLTSARTFGVGPGTWLTQGGWPAANGTAIWQSKGSDGNTLEGNGPPP